MAKDKPRFVKPPAPTQTGPQPPQSDDPVEMASEMSFPASDPPASRRPRGADAGLPHDALATHAEDGRDAQAPGRVEGQGATAPRPTEPPPT